MEALMSPGERISEKLSLFLPREVKYVESYMTWLEELAEHVEKTAICRASSLENYIKLILSQQKKLVLDLDSGVLVVPPPTKDEGDDDEDSDWADSVGNCGRKLNVAAMYTYVGDYSSSNAYLDELTDDFLAALNLTEKYRRVIRYLRESLRWAIRALQDSSNVVRGWSKLNMVWEVMDEKDDQVRATLAFMKACLSAEMKCSEEITLKLMREATTLDPECHIWYHYKYRIVRRIRRNVKRSGGYRLLKPSKEEREAAEKGYELNTSDVVAVTDYALVFKESLWVEQAPEWEKNEETYLKATELFERAYRIATETSNKKWQKKIKVYLAEFLVFGKGSKLDQDKGKVMFDELAKEYPKSSFVLHKVAKLYHHGLRRQGEAHDGKCVDLDLARHYYQVAISSHPSNFACLMDYLKLLQRLGNHGEMLEAAEAALLYASRDYQVAKLMVLKGFITWIHNPRNLKDFQRVAVETWLNVIRTHPTFSREIYLANELLYFDKDHPSLQVRREILSYLETALITCTDHSEADELEAFQAELAKAITPASKRYPSGGGKADGLVEKMKGLNMSSRGGRGEQTKHGGRGNSRTAPKQNSGARKSDADQDGDWRKPGEE